MTDGSTWHEPFGLDDRFAWRAEPELPHGEDPAFVEYFRGLLPRDA
jgi:hypothetical protein